MFDWFKRGTASEYQSVRSTSSSSEGSSDESHLSIKSADEVESKSTVAAGLDKVKGFLGIKPDIPPEEKTFAQEFDEAMTMSRTTRLYAFAITFVIGWLVSIMSLFAVPQIVLHPEKFALLYTFGNIISLGSTAFLWGPCQQIKDMFKPIRVGATLIYFFSMFLTLFCAFKLKMILPTLIAIAIQFAAMVWYSASYVPYGHDFLKSCFGSCCSLVVG